MKCYPVIRGCGYAKVMMGLVLVGVALYILSNSFELDCLSMTKNCPTEFEKFLEKTTSESDDVIEKTKTSEIASYCDCLSSCINYLAVYENDKSSADTTNCYPMEAAAGVAPTSLNVPSGATSTGGSGAGQSTVPGTDSFTCMSCTAMNEKYGEYLSRYIAGMAALSGIALLITAGCEHMEMKWHGKLYACCVFVTDLLAGIVLAAGVSVAFAAMAVAHASCDPESFWSAVKDGGVDSTNNNADQASGFAQFFMAILLPLMKNMCAEKNPLALYALAGTIGVFGSLTSFFASVCVCLHCSDDGIDGTPDDHAAVHMQHLMQNDDQY